jgi:hypothetical protein
MSISIQTSDGKSDIFGLGQWPNYEYDPTTITVLVAEGRELDLILAHFKNLPHTDHWLQVWFGDTAKMVYRALPGLPGFLAGDPKGHPAGRRLIHETVVYDGRDKTHRILNLTTGTVYTTEFPTKEAADAAIEHGQTRDGRTVVRHQLPAVAGLLNGK